MLAYEEAGASAAFGSVFLFNAATVGRTTRLLLERKGKHDGQLIGKSPWLQSVHVTAPGLAIGDMVDVRITSAGPNSLGAEPLVEAVA